MSLVKRIAKRVLKSDTYIPKKVDAHVYYVDEDGKKITVGYIFFYPEDGSIVWAPAWDGSPLINAIIAKQMIKVIGD